MDTTLARALVAEFLSQERRYVLCDWEPATLDGGQFAELAARIIYHIDSGNLNRRKSVDSCLSYVEDPNNSNPHAFPHRRTALHLARVLRTVYKFRSQRGAVHIDPDYSANELDSTLVIGCVRWVMAEILRIFWTGDAREAARAIREIIRYEVPSVLEVDERHLVLRTDCSVEEEVLILLHNAGERGMTRDALGAAVPKTSSAISKALAKLQSATRREVLRRGRGSLILTPLGSKRVREELAPKLTIG